MGVVQRKVTEGHLGCPRDQVWKRERNVKRLVPPASNLAPKVPFEGPGVISWPSVMGQRGEEADS